MNASKKTILLLFLVSIVFLYFLPSPAFCQPKPLPGKPLKQPPSSKAARLAREHYEAGLKLQAKKEWAQAEDQFLKAVELDETFVEAYIELSMTYYRMARPAEAEKNLAWAVQLNYRYDRAYYVLALIGLRQGDPRKALESVQKAILLDSRQWRYHFLEGAILLRLGKPQEAASSLKKALELDRSNPAIKANLALAYASLQDKEKSDILLAEALGSLPQDYQTNLIKGILLAGQGNSNAAYDYFMRASRISPDEPESYYNMALLDIEAGRRGEGEFNLIRAMEMNRYDYLPFLELGRLYLSEKRYEDALVMLSRARELNPASPRVNLEIGLLYMAMERLDEGESALQKAALLDPENAAIRNALGSAFRHQGKFEEADREYRRALLIDPAFTAVYFNLANLYEDQGKIEEALASLDSYLKSAPSDQDEVQKRIEILRESLALKKEKP
jgi:tetratricopeptide (TPR) repeat protein